MSDLLTMARSFGSHILLMMQNAASAVGDARMLKTVYTNIKWSFSMRGEPRDCAFLKSVLPVTGRKLRPQASPFQEKSFYSLAERDRKWTAEQEGDLGATLRKAYQRARGKGHES